MKNLMKRMLRKLVSAAGIRELVREEVDDSILQSMRKVDYGLQFRAIMRSAEYVEENIPLHLRFSVHDLWTEALSRAKNEGLLLEFGVYRGNSIRHFADRTDKQIFGFDSFEGLPEAWTLLNKGHFALDTLPKVPANVTLIKGWFNETLPGFLEEHPEPVAFMHLDCDLYSSTKYVLETTANRIKKGTVIVMDDFLEEPGFQHQMHKAFHEFVAERGLKYEWLAYTVSKPSCSVALIVTEAPSADAAG